MIDQPFPTCASQELSTRQTPCRHGDEEPSRQKTSLGRSTSYLQLAQWRKKGYKDQWDHSSSCLTPCQLNYNLKNRQYWQLCLITSLSRHTHPAPQIQDNLPASATTTQKFIATTVTEKNWKVPEVPEQVKKYSPYTRCPSATANFWQTLFGGKRKRRTYDCWYWQFHAFNVGTFPLFPTSYTTLKKKINKRTVPKDNSPQPRLLDNLHLSI